jgi:ATP-dependent DNA helicase RecG
MQDFRTGAVNVLVATSIIEVGVDVPEATVMVIENAERFGIAQLHQLRGRVGRGPGASTCYLLSDPHTEEAVDRLQALVHHQDGLALAELDLTIRGPGEVLGLRQHGVSGFQLARPLADLAILEEARQAARELLAGDPSLTHPEHAILRRWMLAPIDDQEPQRVLN